MVATVPHIQERGLSSLLHRHVYVAPTAMCASAAGQMAVELQTKAAEETASLKPAHTYVPWVTVNGIPVGGAFEQLQTFVCASYLGERYLQLL